MSNLSVRPVQPCPQVYYQPRMVPVQFAPLPDLFHAMPLDTAQFRYRGPVSPAPVQLYAPAYVPNYRPAADTTYQLPQNLIRRSEPTTYRGKMVKSLELAGEGTADQLIGAGTMVAGTLQTAVYAPLGALEAVGRTAVAITGGNVSYDRPSPLHRMGEGVEIVGQGAGQVLVGTAKQAVGVTGALVYAPLASLELVAHGAGMVAGGAVWVGKQVSDSFVGQEFKAGYHDVMPSRN